VNRAPELPAVASPVVVNELEELVLTNRAIEPNIHSVSVGYGLLSGPEGMSIDGAGVIRWVPSQEQSPSTNVVVVGVTNANPYDGVNPQLSATNSFVVTVQVIHNGPMLPGQGNRTIDVRTTMTVTNTASDSDIPMYALNYMLLLAPTNALIDGDGIITWTPTLAQGGSTNLFTTVVTDDGLPPLSATNWFEVIVNPAPVIPQPVIQSVVVTNGVAILTWTSQSNQWYCLQYCGGLGMTNWTDVLPAVQASGSTATATNVLGGSAQYFYRVLVVPSP